MYNYASALALGNGVERDRAQALQWFRRAADMGHVKSINFIGSFYEDGWEVDANASIALDYYRRAAVGGDFRGQFNYARLLAGHGEIDVALAWLRRVPQSATTAFVAKMQAWLALSPVDAFRALAKQLNADLRAPLALDMSADAGMGQAMNTDTDRCIGRGTTTGTPAAAMTPRAQESRA
jgi:TPR repeat protein